MSDLVGKQNVGFLASRLILFCFSWLRTLVGLSTYSSQWENGNWQFMLSRWGYLDCFTELFIELSSTFYMSFVLIAEFVDVHVQIYENNIRISSQKPKGE